MNFVEVLVSFNYTFSLLSNLEGKLNRSYSTDGLRHKMVASFYGD